MKKSSAEFKGSYVLITGASSGIGAAIAEKFLEAGAFVGLHYSKNKPKISSKNACLIQADLGTSKGVKDCFKKFSAFSKGKIDILVNNAADIGKGTDLFDLDEYEWDSVFNVNLKAPFLLSREALKIMLAEKSGAIINISSIGVKFGGSRKTAPYSISKAALDALTRTLAKVSAEKNVRVNAIHTGVTDTAVHKKIGQDIKKRTALIPMKRMARPDEIASAVLFLASSESSFITGTILPVAGGE